MTQNNDQIDINFLQVVTPPDECAKHGKSMGISQSWCPGKYVCVDCILERQTAVADGKMAVDESALRQVLQAIMGPPHLIRELVVLNRFEDSPINKLIADFNAEIDRMNKAVHGKDS